MSEDKQCNSIPRPENWPISKQFGRENSPGILVGWSEWRYKDNFPVNCEA